jgi:CMP-N,N'-diacetyllegionaminic acid synthase
LPRDHRWFAYEQAQDSKAPLWRRRGQEGDEGIVEVLGVVPARGGSKGVRRKNLRLLAGDPLIQYTFRAAAGSGLLTRLIVSTEDDEIATFAQDHGIEVLRRPRSLAGDDTPMLPVLQHALQELQAREEYQPEIVTLLQPTAPLRRAEHIDGALSLLREQGANSVVSVCRVPGHHHPEWQFTLGEDAELRSWSGRPLREIIVRRQDLPPTYTRNGAIYAVRTTNLLRDGTFYPRPCLAYVMPPSASVNVDSLADFALAKWWLEHGPIEHREAGTAPGR